MLRGNEQDGLPSCVAVIGPCRHVPIVTLSEELQTGIIRSQPLVENRTNYYVWLQWACRSITPRYPRLLEHSSDPSDPILAGERPKRRSSLSGLPLLNLSFLSASSINILSPSPRRVYLCVSAYMLFAITHPSHSFTSL
jgi:hypothetical protein